MKVTPIIVVCIILPLMLIMYFIITRKSFQQEDCKCHSDSTFIVEKDSLTSSIYGEYSVVGTDYPITIVFEGHFKEQVKIKRNNDEVFSNMVKTIPVLEVDTNTVRIDTSFKHDTCYKIEVTIFSEGGTKNLCFLAEQGFPVIYIKKFLNSSVSVIETNYMKSYTY